MKKSLNWSETIITAVIKACGYSAIVFVLLIFFFLLREGLPALTGPAPQTGIDTSGSDASAAVSSATLNSTSGRRPLR